jgi:hypothetical protein
MRQKSDVVETKENKYLSGSGVIELILIMVVLIAVVILFKGQITALADLIFAERKFCMHFCSRLFLFLTQ